VEIVKGQRVWVFLNIGKSRIIETTIKSIGPKYITLYADGRLKFYRSTLREVNGVGVSSYIILDLDEYNKNQYYSNLITKLKNTDWKHIDREDLEKVADIIADY